MPPRLSRLLSEQKVLPQSGGGSAREDVYSLAMKDEGIHVFILLINDKSEISVIKEAITATSSSLQTVHREIQ